ncbi:MAG: glycoside hydrolase family 127 protein [Promethearchaeota archaeon]
MTTLKKVLNLLNEIDITLINIVDDFWTPRLKRNAKELLFYQYEQLERTKCIDNFRILAENKNTLRKGFFFSDSDAYKWAEAAALSLTKIKDQNLKKILDAFIELIEKTQEDDGYIYTYNQINFPNRRWSNLLMEHELYCMGHLIEAGIAHFYATNSTKFLNIAKMTADLIVREFTGKPSEWTPGHEEIELALIRLYKLTQNLQYLNLARQFLEERGKISFFTFKMIGSFMNQLKYEKQIKKKLRIEKTSGKKEKSHDITENLIKKENFLFMFRMLNSVLSGTYFQQKYPFNKLKKAEGHSVRFGYYMVGHTMLFHEINDQSKVNNLNRIWDNMVIKRMYITGGLGSIPIIEGFGRDYELSNKHAYCETCAAISSIFWNWEMLKCTRNAKYADLLEWQLYNASLVGLANEKNLYFYRNILESEGNFQRNPWFDTPCCPSNLSRLWGMIGKYIYSINQGNLWIHQYIGNTSELDVPINIEGNPVSLSIKIISSFPWQGKSEISLDLERSASFSINFRIPSWTNSFSININNIPHISKIINEDDRNFKNIKTAGGYSPYDSFYFTIEREWHPNDKISIEFPMNIKIHHSHPKVKNNKNMVAISRGPLVYCLEDIDNPNAKIPNARIDLNYRLEAIFSNKFFNGIYIIKGKDFSDNFLTFIPYFLWANRGKSKMQVYVSEK